MYIYVAVKLYKLCINFATSFVILIQTCLFMTWFHVIISIVANDNFDFDCVILNQVGCLNIK